MLINFTILSLPLIIVIYNSCRLSNPRNPSKTANTICWAFISASPPQIPDYSKFIVTKASSFFPNLIPLAFPKRVSYFYFAIFFKSFYSSMACVLESETFLFLASVYLFYFIFSTLIHIVDQQHLLSFQASFDN